MVSLEIHILTAVLTRTTSFIPSAMVTAKGDVWNPSEEVISNCNAEVSEVLRSVLILLSDPSYPRSDLF